MVKLLPTCSVHWSQYSVASQLNETFFGSAVYSVGGHKCAVRIELLEENVKRTETKSGEHEGDEAIMQVLENLPYFGSK